MSSEMQMFFYLYSYISEIEKALFKIWNPQLFSLHTTHMSLIGANE